VAACEQEEFLQYLTAKRKQRKQAMKIKDLTETRKVKQVLSRGWQQWRGRI
jgi:hypothetical protein